MPKYAYKAVNREGKEVFGVIESDSAALAVNDVRSLGLFPTTVREARKSDEKRARKRKKGFSDIYFGGVRTKQLVIMTRQLSTLIDAGLLMDQAKALLAQPANWAAVEALAAALLERRHLTGQEATEIIRSAIEANSPRDVSEPEL